MSTTLHLPGSMMAAVQRRTESENALGVSSFCLSAATGAVASMAERLQRDPENTAYIFGAKAALARLREREREWKNALSHCNAARADLVVAVASVIGECAACGAPTAGGFLGPYCGDCLDESVPL